MCGYALAVLFSIQPESDLLFITWPPHSGSVHVRSAQNVLAPNRAAEVADATDLHVTLHKEVAQMVLEVERSDAEREVKA